MNYPTKNVLMSVIKLKISQNVESKTSNSSIYPKNQVAEFWCNSSQ